MTSQGTPSGRSSRAIAQKDLTRAEMSMRKMGAPSLLIALDYLVLVAGLRSEKAQLAAIGWHGRLELEAVRANARRVPVRARGAR